MSLAANKKGMAWGAGIVITIAAVLQAWSYLADFFEEKGWPSISEVAALKTDIRCLKLDRRLPGLRRWKENSELGTDNHIRATDTLESAEEEWDTLDCPKVLIR